MKKVLNNAYADAALNAEIARHALWYAPLAHDSQWMENFERAKRFEAVCQYILRRSRHI